MKLSLIGAAAAAAILIGSAASAAPVIEVEGNDTLTTAQNIDDAFSLEADADIQDSTTLAHATVIGGAGDNTYDFYSFSVGQNSRGIFDIDYGMPGFDSFLTLYAPDGTELASSDDYYGPLGGTGSSHPYDSFIDYDFAQAGIYTIRVGNCCVSPLYRGDGYHLQVSLGDHAIGAVPEPATWAMMIGGFGMIGGTMRSARRRQKVALATA